MSEEAKQLIRQRICEATRNEWSDAAREAAKAKRRQAAKTHVAGEPKISKYAGKGALIGGAISGGARAALVGTGAIAGALAKKKLGVNPFTMAVGGRWGRMAALHGVGTATDVGLGAGIGAMVGAHKRKKYRLEKQGITKNEWSEEARQAAIEARRRRRAGTAVGAGLGATAGLVGTGLLMAKGGPRGLAKGIGAVGKYAGRKLFGTAAKSASMTGRGVQAAAPATKGLLGSGGARATARSAGRSIKTAYRESKLPQAVDDIGYGFKTGFKEGRQEIGRAASTAAGAVGGAVKKAANATVGGVRKGAEKASNLGRAARNRIRGLNQGGGVGSAAYGPAHPLQGQVSSISKSIRRQGVKKGKGRYVGGVFKRQY